MSELLRMRFEDLLARYDMNAPVRDALDARVFVGEYDAPPRMDPILVFTEDELLGLDDDVSVYGGLLGPRMKNEVLP